MRPSHDPQKAQSQLIGALRKHKNDFYPIMKFPPVQQFLLMNFTASNPDLEVLNLQDTAAFDTYINALLQKEHATMGAGGYLENRVIYKRSAVFQGAENRCFHLGIDIWAPAHTAVFAPYAATIHSFNNNAAFGDYGPTIILRHELENIPFFTLFGHLSSASLQNLKKGQRLQKGNKIGEIGPFPENGDWPPHLHFQLITDIGNHQGDFPGVAAPSELEKYKHLCPSPNLILNLAILEQTAI